MINFTFFNNVFYAIYTLKSINSHISFVAAASFNLEQSQNCILGKGLKLFNPLLNDKFLDVTKFKEFADDKLKVAKMTIFLYD